MKVIYAKTIIEKLNEAIAKAAKDRREIDHIVLDADEFAKLTKFLFSAGLSNSPSISNHYYKGILIEKELPF